MLQPKPISRTRRRPSLTTLVLAFALFVSFPAGVVASHLFSDVPTAHTFHDNITNLYNARITTGCGVGTYCPEQAVNRGQMAGFLNRGLGRATTDSGILQNIDGGGTYNVAAATIKTGGAPGGTGFLFVTGTVQFRVIGDGYCPCTVGLQLNGTPGRTTYVSVPDIDTPYGVFFPNSKWESLSNNSVMVVNSATEYTIELETEVVVTAVSTDDITLWGDISLVYVPFGWDGGSSLAE